MNQKNGTTKDQAEEQKKHLLEIVRKLIVRDISNLTNYRVLVRLDPNSVDPNLVTVRLRFNVARDGDVPEYKGFYATFAYSDWLKEEDPMAFTFEVLSGAMLVMSHRTYLNEGLAEEISEDYAWKEDHNDWSNES
jgi:hypothetical protein